MSVSYSRLRDNGKGIYTVTERRVGFLKTLKETRVKVFKPRSLWLYVDSKKPLDMPWLIDDLIVAKICERGLAELEGWKYGRCTE